VRWRDLTCRWPGCDAPVERYDIDHTVPYPVGATHPSDLKAYCRTHYRVSGGLSTPSSHHYWRQPGHGRWWAPSSGANCPTTIPANGRHCSTPPGIGRYVSTPANRRWPTPAVKSRRGRLVGNRAELARRQRVLRGTAMDETAAGVMTFSYGADYDEPRPHSSTTPPSPFASPGRSRSDYSRPADTQLISFKRWPVTDEPAASSASSCSGVSVTDSEPRFSSTRAARRVPGIGTEATPSASAR
jgi:hypothetical protein